MANDVSIIFHAEDCPVRGNALNLYITRYHSLLANYQYYKQCTLLQLLLVCTRLIPVSFRRADVTSIDQLLSLWVMELIMLQGRRYMKGMEAGIFYFSEIIWSS